MGSRFFLLQALSRSLSRLVLRQLQHTTVTKEVTVRIISSSSAGIYIYIYEQLHLFTWWKEDVASSRVWGNVGFTCKTKSIRDGGTPKTRYIGFVWCASYFWRYWCQRLENETNHGGKVPKPEKRDKTRWGGDSVNLLYWGHRTNKSRRSYIYIYMEHSYFSRDETCPHWKPLCCFWLQLLNLAEWIPDQELAEVLKYFEIMKFTTAACFSWLLSFLSNNWLAPMMVFIFSCEASPGKSTETPSLPTRHGGPSVQQRVWCWKQACLMHGVSFFRASQVEENVIEAERLAVHWPFFYRVQMVHRRKRSERGCLRQSWTRQFTYDILVLPYVVLCCLDMSWSGSAEERTYQVEFKSQGSQMFFLSLP